MNLNENAIFQENSFLRLLGHLDLDLPKAPQKAARPPPPPVDPYSRYGPKEEITHLFRAPEKKPPQNLSLIFLGLILLPSIVFLVGVSLIITPTTKWHKLICFYLREKALEVKMRKIIEWKQKMWCGYPDMLFLYDKYAFMMVTKAGMRKSCIFGKKNYIN